MLLDLRRGTSYLCVGLALPALLSRHAKVVESALATGVCYSFLFAYARVFLYQEQEPIAEMIFSLITTIFLTFCVLDHVKLLSVQRQ